MNVHAVAQFLRNTPLAELGPVADALAERLYVHRQANHGWTPKELFMPAIDIGGVYVSVEITIQVLDEKGKHVGYALKRRGETGEIAWAGQHQIVGATATLMEGSDEMLARAAEEIYADAEARSIFLGNTRFIGVNVHGALPRRAICWNIMYLACIAEREIANFKGEWDIFLSPEDSRIIDHHRETLRWIADLDRPIVADLRDPRYANQ